MVSRSKAGYKHRCYYYKPNYNENETLEKAKEIQGVIYLKKIREIVTSNFIGSTKTIETTLEVETPDFNDEVDIDYFVELENTLYRVSDLFSKEIDERGRKIYTINLKKAKKGVFKNE